MKRVRVIAAYVVLALSFVFLLGGVCPEHVMMPVHAATPKNWNPKSFWHDHWGESGVHKGIDIFAARGTAAEAPVGGVVLYAGTMGRGGNVVLLLGPKWRLHYMAHLDKLDVHTAQWLSRGDKIGDVGDSGNAKGKPPHMHYSLVTLVPYPHRWSSGPEGWKKIFFLDPGLFLSARVPAYW